MWASRALETLQGTGSLFALGRLSKAPVLTLERAREPSGKTNRRAGRWARRRGGLHQLGQGVCSLGARVLNKGPAVPVQQNAADTPQSAGLGSSQGERETLTIVTGEGMG